MLRDNKVIFIATLANLGKCGFAPGTMGSLVAIIAAPFLFVPLGLVLKIVVWLALLIVGIKICDRAVVILNNDDPKEVIVDEWVGQWLVCLPFGAMQFWEYLAAFILFRLFDIYKPWVIKNFERLPSGLGVMMDDVAAGFFALGCLSLLRWLVG